ncbi:multicopper oxidase family protein [Streptomyces turgidiscabies]|uniref:Suppressor of ftsI n=1 Tax=Streptomyces turgidiscabies TaxID=85558 RepID=A0ABU0S1K1_9ACTN|nr:multicopper oxidase domain-containing protein [Streptomyces turgidiscabies]MDQ0937262.1 suppressor of ftsI [Streptomyces turgidiscabies]
MTDDHRGSDENESTVTLSGASGPGRAKPPKRPRTIGRRILLATAGLVGIGLVGGGAYAVNFARVYKGRKLSNVGELSFANKVRIPPLMEGQDDGSGRRVFKLTAQSGKSRLLPGKETPTWGINGAYLGPTLRARRGQKVAVSLTNRLPEATTLHWHGMHLPPEMDGGPHQMVQPGADWNPEWEISQPAATLWYHPHPHESTADHVSRGVAGLFILEDDEADRSGLPNSYGVDDIPLILQDRQFNDDGSIDLRGASFMESLAGVGSPGVLGDTILVNGTYDPHVQISTTLVRFRLMNASGARTYNLGFTDSREFHLVAQDNGLLERPLPLRRLQLTPGERAEIVVAFKPKDRVVLRSFEPELGLAFPTDRLGGGDDTFDMIEVRARERLTDSRPLPDTLRGAPAAISVPEKPHTRTFEFNSYQINGKSMDMSRIDEVVPAGKVEIWEVTGDAEVVHNFHVHGLTFNVLEYAGKKPEAWQRGPKDTVRVPSGGTVRLAVALPSHTDSKIPYMYHCHILRHEDLGMMGQFTVVKPGTENSAPRTIDSAHH